MLLQIHIREATQPLRSFFECVGGIKKEKQSPDLIPPVIEA